MMLMLRAHVVSMVHEHQKRHIHYTVYHSLGYFFEILSQLEDEDCVKQEWGNFILRRTEIFRERRRSIMFEKS